VDRKNAATRQDVIANSVDHQILTLANSAASQEQLESLLTSELDHDLIAWPRQYLETYLDSDETGRVPLHEEELQDVLDAAFDRDAALAREYLDELAADRTPVRLGESTLEIATVRREGKRAEYQLLFDPRDRQDLKHLIDKLELFASGKRQALVVPAREALPGLPFSVKQLAPDVHIKYAQTDSGTYRGKIISDSETILIQRITAHSAVVHEKNLLDMVPAVGENVRIAYSNDIGCVVAVKERTNAKELAR